MEADLARLEAAGSERAGELANRVIATQREVIETLIVVAEEIAALKDA